MRFHDPQEGTMNIDGVDIKSVSLQSLRLRARNISGCQFLTDEFSGIKLIS